jgi:lysyl-tRNA synthetase class 2
MPETWWRPDIYAKRRPNLVRRAGIMRAIRAFFDSRDFVEVETPYLQISPGLEPHLQAFATELKHPDGSTRPLYLHTSPEFAMKKLLTAGEERLYQLARVWRNGERSERHHPEFTMLEWYRAGATYFDLMEDCEALLRAVTNGEPYVRGNLACEITGPFERLSVTEAFARYCDIDLVAILDNKPGMHAAARRLGIRTAPDDLWDDIFHRIAMERIEPHLGMGRPTFLYDYPVAMAALSRPKPEDERFAERFELYVCGIELANAFGELTDPALQRARFEADMDLKEQLYGDRYPIDPGFLAALDLGLPASAGIALGVDRLVMLAVGADRLEDVLWAEVTR